MAEYIIENLTYEELQKLEQHPEIEWLIDDLQRDDIFVYNKSDADKILEIIGRRC